MVCVAEVARAGWDLNPQVSYKEQRKGVVCGDLRFEPLQLGNFCWDPGWRQARLRAHLGHWSRGTRDCCSLACSPVWSSRQPCLHGPIQWGIGEQAKNETTKIIKVKERPGCCLWSRGDQNTLFSGFLSFETWWRDIGGIWVLMQWIPSDIKVIIQRVNIW